MYRMKEWRASSRLMAKREKRKNWLGPFWKSCVCVPSTPGSELKKRMQKKEEETRAGGREGWPIRIIEMAGKTLEHTLVNVDPFNGNQCKDKKCLPNQIEVRLTAEGIVYATKLFALSAGRLASQKTSQHAFLGNQGKICTVVLKNIFQSLIVKPKK